MVLSWATRRKSEQAPIFIHGTLTRLPAFVPFMSTAKAKSKTAKSTSAKAPSGKTAKSFEQNLWDTADKLRGTVESSEYKHVVLSLIFLKFVSDKFLAQRQKLSNEGMGEYLDTVGDEEEDVVGRVYEYFLGNFAATEGKGGGEFYTPKCVVNLIAEMIEPYRGKIYDPCCGSGGMFVQSLKFVENHEGNQKDISIYG